MSILKQTVDIREYLDDFENEVYVIAHETNLGDSERSLSKMVDTGGIVYEPSENSDYYICKGYSGDVVGEITIKASIEGVYVREIAAGAFEYNNEITSVTLPANLWYIGERAFAGCTALTYVGMACPTLKTIGDRAFSGCVKLAKISIPKSVQALGEGVFENCTRLSQITLQAGLKSIGASAFLSCTGLTSISLPDSLESIGSHAFRLAGLRSITTPDNLTYIGENAFAGCTNLLAASLGASLLGVSGALFYGCSKLTSVSIPETVDKIDFGAFRDCTSLTEITIPAKVKAIGVRAFYGCTNLEVVNFGNEHGWFYSTFENGTIPLPQSLIAGQNCEHVPTITPRLLTQNFAGYTWFRLEKMLAPLIDVTDDGILTIIDNTGLADSFSLYVNNSFAVKITARDDESIPEHKYIEAGTYVAKDNITLPPVGTKYNLTFRARNGETAWYNCVQIRCVQEDTVASNDPVMVVYATSYAEDAQGMAFAFTNEYGVVVTPNEYAKYLYVDDTQVVGDALYEWFNATYTKVG